MAGGAGITQAGGMGVASLWDNAGVSLAKLCKWQLTSTQRATCLPHEGQLTLPSLGYRPGQPKGAQPGLPALSRHASQPCYLLAARHCGASYSSTAILLTAKPSISCRHGVCLPGSPPARRMHD